MKQTDIELLLADIRREISVKRAKGEYPPGLEQELEVEFKAIMDLIHRGMPQRDKLILDGIDQVQTKMSQLNGRISTSSRVPLLGLVRRLARLITSHQIRGLANQVREVDEAIVNLVRVLADEALAREDADKRMVASLSKHVIDRIAVVDHLAILLPALEQRIDELEKSKHLS